MKEIKLCQLCRTAHIKGKWKSFQSLEELLQMLGAETSDIPVHTENAGVTVIIPCMGVDKVAFDVPIAWTICPKCSKIGTKYFEGILQLRNPEEDVTDYILKSLDRQYSKGVFLTDCKDVRGGVDFYITSQHFLRQLGKKLSDQFGGAPVVSRHLQGFDKQRSKMVYRVNVLYTVPEFREGSVVSWEGGVGVLRKIQKKRVILHDFVKDKNVNVLMESIHVLKPVKTSICKCTPHVEVLHPETYQAVVVQNATNQSLGQKVKVVSANGLWYIV